MERKKIRIAFDCNIIASALLGGITRKRFLEVLDLDAEVDIYYCDELIEEIRNLSKVSYFVKKGISQELIEEFVSLFIKRSKRAYLIKKETISRDRKDNYLLDLCREAKLNYLITGDKDLLVLEKFNTAQIILFAEFMESNY